MVHATTSTARTFPSTRQFAARMAALDSCRRAEHFGAPNGAAAVPGGLRGPQGLGLLLQEIFKNASAFLGMQACGEHVGRVHGWGLSTTHHT